MAAAIELNDVVLVRRTQEELHYDLKRTALNLLRGRGRKTRRRTVLDRLGLRVEHGEKIGMIGPNGSGKSTVLKLIAGVLQPTRGSVSVEGTVAPLIEIGVGFDPDLTLVDNVVYYGVLMGHDEDVVRAHIDAILDFAELGSIRDQPTKTLSSGMNARLGFAIATEFRPDILLLDEVLSVGDERFRRKCAARIERFWDANSTIVLVSHDMVYVARTCDRVIWIDGGQVIFDGPAVEGTEKYLESVPAFSGFASGAQLIELAIHHKNGEIAVRGTSPTEQGLQIFLIRNGHRHWIHKDQFYERTGYVWNDLIHVSDAVILEVPEGDPIT
jgi:ABC-type polysaccharide/polyol phosphate transport system ATPase subunit